MHGYGEFIWIEGKKYVGFYKNDKKDGFGIYYWPNNKLFVGFWREGKQNGVGKYIKGEAKKFGIWKDGKRQKWLDTVDEFTDCLDPSEEKYASIFQWNTSQIRRYMDLDEKEDDNDRYKDDEIINKNDRKDDEDDD